MAIDLQDEIVVRTIAPNNDAATQLTSSQALPTGTIARLTLEELQSLIASPVKSYATIIMLASQSGASGDDHVEWDSIAEQSANNDISISTGVGQQLGLITLPAGKVFSLQCSLGVQFSNAAGVLDYDWRDNTAGQLIGHEMRAHPYTLATDFSPAHVCNAFAPASTLEVEVRFNLSTSVTGIQRTDQRGTWCRVFEL